jgi:cytochrome P450
VHDKEYPAGHETTSNTLSWILFELSKHPAIQEKLRSEIRATRAKANDREDKRLQISDLESMKYTMSVMKASPWFTSSEMALDICIPGVSSLPPYRSAIIQEGKS